MPFCVRLHLIASIFFAALLQTCTIANAEPMKDFSAARRCFVENPGQGVVINGYRYLISKHIFDINDNINESIANIYGQNARIADWVELSKLNFSDLNELADGIGLSRQTSRSECFNLFVSVDDALSPDGKNRYLIARHNGIIPSQWTSLAQLGHNFINLGRWTYPSQALIVMPDEIQNTPVTSATNSAPPVVNNRNNATIDTPPTEQNRIPVNNTAATINTFNYNGSMFNQQHDATYNRQSGAIRGAEQDLKYLIAIIILMVSIFVIVLGAMNKVVIYMDSTDLGLNIIPLPLIFLGIGIGELMNILIFKVIIDAVAISAAVAVAAYNFRNSLRFNSFLSTTYNIIVATAKLSFSIIAICLSVIWVGDVLDKKDVARAVKSAALLGLMAALVSKLINGKAVYLARGLSVVPDQVDSEEPDHSPIAG